MVGSCYFVTLSQISIATSFDGGGALVVLIGGAK